MDQCFFTAMRKANRILFRRYQKTLSCTGVSIVQFSILWELEQHGSLNLSRLADELAMERTSLYRTIEPLVKKGKVKIKPSSKGKAKIAELTNEGLNTIKRVMPYWSALQDEILEEVGDNVLNDLVTLLNLISGSRNPAKVVKND